MEQKQVETQALAITERANALIVKSPEQYTIANQVWMELRDTRKQVAETFDPIIQKAHEAHKEAVAQKKKIDAPLEAAQRSVKSLMSVYYDEQERIRKEKEAEIRRQKEKEEEERRLAEAESAEKAGLHEVADAILEERPSINVKVESEIEKISGGAVHRKIWKFRIVDEKAIPREYLSINEVKIGQVVRALQKDANIPGIEIYQESV